MEELQPPHSSSPVSGAYSLLKMVCPDLFPSECFDQRIRIASGGTATIYECESNNYSHTAMSAATRRSTSARPRTGTVPEQNMPKGLSGEELKDGHATVALKVIDRDNSSHQFSIFPDVFSEIRLLSQLSDQRNVCQLLDYGVSADSYYLVMRLYTTSLLKWRTDHGNISHSPQYTVFRQVYLEIYRIIIQVLCCPPAKNSLPTH